MRHALKQVSFVIDQINGFAGKAVAWLTLGLVLLTVFDVLIRYLFQESQAWVMELEWHLFAAIFLLGAGFALRHDRHVRVDLFYSKMTPRHKAQVDFWGTLVLLLPWCLLVIWASYPSALESYRIGEGSPDPGGLSYRFVIKLVLLLGFCLLLLQGISQVIQSSLLIWGASEDKS